MLDDEEVLAAFAAMADLTVQEAEPWRQLCAACARHLEGRLWRGSVPLGGAQALVLAAAAMANRRRVAREAVGADLRLGELQIRESAAASLEQAKELERQYLELAQAFLRPKGVAFQGVDPWA